uniref:Uncharacterized protein n=2 Tax=Sus scrofa TaxID=9823 RepID=A0A8D0S576_PIG
RGPIGAVATGLRQSHSNGWPGGPAGLAALKPKQLPQKQKTIPFFSGSCFSVLLLPLTWRCCRSNIGNGS